MGSVSYPACGSMSEEMAWGLDGRGNESGSVAVAETTGLGNVAELEAAVSLVLSRFRNRGRYGAMWNRVLMGVVGNSLACFVLQ